MELGAFSISLNVADLTKSQDFYGALGFVAVGGDASQGWVILRNGTTTIGLFKGMFEKNILTFNPGWNAAGETLGSFEDVRAIQRKLLGQSIELTTTVDESSSGPGSIAMLDPDGNPVLIDQHV
ncbi:MAG TPA: VOC family protein [Woeseiaceae bacterium]|nr:VOC family protein [Woeseiaceae bacterium]